MNAAEELGSVCLEIQGLTKTVDELAREVRLEEAKPAGTGVDSAKTLDEVVRKRLGQTGKDLIVIRDLNKCRMLDVKLRSSSTDMHAFLYCYSVHACCLLCVCPIIVINRSFLSPTPLSPFPHSRPPLCPFPYSPSRSIATRPTICRPPTMSGTCLSGSATDVETTSVTNVLLSTSPRRTKLMLTKSCSRRERKQRSGQRQRTC